MFEAKAFRIFIRIYSLLKSERLSINIKLTLHKALIRSVMTSACLAWELAADIYFLKLQRMQKKILHIIGNSPWCMPVRDLHTAFDLLYVYNYIPNLCNQQAEVIENHENEYFRGVGHGEARY
jgi:hypothetical protein